jgi:two-component sensor histidine kinase
MGPSYNFYNALLFFSALVSTMIALAAWRRRHEPGALAFACLMAGVTVWCLAYAGELAALTIPAKVAWIHVEFIGILVVPTAWLISAAGYVSRGRWPARRWLLLLAVVPAGTLLLVWTSDWHAWFWTGVILISTGNYPVLLHKYGPAFWFNAVYTYAVMWAATAIMFRRGLRWWPHNRDMALTLLIGSLVPWLGNLAYLFAAPALGYLDPTPVAFAVAGVFFAFIIFRLRLVDIVPMAHDAVFEHLGDAVIVVDGLGRVVDANSTARQLIDRPTAQFIGQPVVRMLAHSLALAEHLAAPNGKPVEVVLPAGFQPRTFDISVTPLLDGRGRHNGRVLSLHDITERQRQAEALRQSEERYRAISADLERRVDERTAELAEANTALRGEIAERERVEAVLRAMLAEKEHMLMEINHRVKNNLQVVSSILSLQEKALDQAPDACDEAPLRGETALRGQARQALQDSQRRVRSMALIHELLYSSHNLAQIDFGDYVRRLGAYLCRSFDADRLAIRLAVEIEDIWLDLAMAVPCGLIINELVTNALQHAFPDRMVGAVCVSMQPLDTGRLQLIVADDGIGLPASVPFPSVTSLGLHIVATLVAQLDGTVEVVRQPGTSFQMVLNRPPTRS